MTDHEISVVLSFLTGGLLVGTVGGWLDWLAAFIKGRG